MIDRTAATDTSAPPLAPALAAMTATQALVAFGLFAPGVLAPKLGLAVSSVSLFATAVFAVGMATSLYGGLLAQRFGPCRVAAGCALAVALAMMIAAEASLVALVVAGLCLGLAFGPETPASATLLGRLASPEQRPLIFSVRQTGNQIGAIAASLSLPVIAVYEPRAGYVLIAALALVMAVILYRLSARYDRSARGAVGSRLDLAAALRFVLKDRALVALAILSVPFSAMQMALNVYLVTFAVSDLRYEHVAAGLLLGVAQAGGLIGRLTWGVVASKLASPRAVLIGLGVGMSAAAVTVALAAPHLSWPVLTAVAFLFGLTASGWNGVFLAEVAGLVPTERVAEATGAVLTASYGGLLAAPVLIAAISGVGGLAASYVVLAVLALAATAQLAWSNRAHD